MQPPHSPFVRAACLVMLGLFGFAAAQDACLLGSWSYQSGYEQIFAEVMGAAPLPIEFGEVSGVHRVDFGADGAMSVHFEDFSFGLVASGPPAIEVLTVMNGSAGGGYVAADGALDTEVASEEGDIAIEQQVLLDGQPFAMPALPFDTLDPVGPQQTATYGYSCDGDTLNLLIEVQTTEGGEAAVPMVYRRAP